MKYAKLLLPLLLNAFSVCMVVLVILDWRNPYQGFLNSRTSHLYILLFSAIALTAGITQIAEWRRNR